MLNITKTLGTKNKIILSTVPFKIKYSINHITPAKKIRIIPAVK